MERERAITSMFSRIGSGTKPIGFNGNEDDPDDDSEDYETKEAPAEAPAPIVLSIIVVIVGGLGVLDNRINRLAGG